MMRKLDHSLIQNVRGRVHPNSPSTGLVAVYWALSLGYKPTVIGYGFVNGVKERNEKVYTNGFVDKSVRHDFAKEDRILKRMQREGLIEII